MSQGAATNRPEAAQRETNKKGGDLSITAL